MSTYPLTVFYDAACLVCAFEMDALRARNRYGQLVFVDIAAPGFDPAPYGVSLAAMNAEIHALRADGVMVRGVEVLAISRAASGVCRFPKRAREPS